MPRLTHRSWQHVCAAAAELAAIDRIEELGSALYDQTRKLLPADRVTFSEVPVSPKTCLVRREFQYPWRPSDPGFLEAFRTYSGMHASWQYLRQTGSERALRMSDLIERRRFRELPLYRECFRAVGTEFQVMILMPVTPKIQVSVGVNRGGFSDFSDRQCLALELLRPHIMRAARRVLATEDAEKKLQLHRRAMTANGNAILLLEQNGRIAFRSPGAAQILTEYFSSPSRSKALPPPLASWFARQVSCGPGERLRLSLSPDRTLVCRLLQERGMKPPVLLELILCRLPQKEGLARSFRLTPREAEVLQWLARGKRNSEIALICGIGVTTVEAYLRVLFLKLSVETRTAAAALAWESTAVD